jgi:hypothetical protein
MTELTLAGNGMVMPSKYIEIDREEMTYIEGGGTITITLSKSYLEAYLGITCAAIGTIIGTAICGGLSGGTAAYVGAFIGGFIGGVIGTRLTQKYAKKDLVFSLNIPLSCIKSKSFVMK